MRILIFLSFLGLPLQGLTIRVDYRLDTAGFFDDPAAKAAIEAAAARWSRVIDQKLAPVDIPSDFRARRFLLSRHPGTGEEGYSFSTARSAATDFVAQGGGGAANAYLDGLTLEEDEWILFVGGRSLGQIGIAVGSPLFGGANTLAVLDPREGFLNRGFNEGRYSLGVLGGVVSFNDDTVWSFDLSNPESTVGTDFYTVALHEIGHGLGLSAKNVKEWSDLSKDGVFRGENALNAFEKDNDQVAMSLEIDNDRLHWGNGLYMAKIFPLGSPSYAGTVGRGQLQELLMEPRIRLGGPVYRAEITNVDIGALKDIGWSVITEDPPPPPEFLLEYSKLESGGLALNFQSKRGAIYIVQTSVDGSVWKNVTPFLTGTGERLSWKDGQEGAVDPYGPAVDLDWKFYRVVEKSTLDVEAPNPGQ